LAAVLLLALTLSLLASFGGAPAGVAALREPGLAVGGRPDDPLTIPELARLRERPASPAISARGALVWDATLGTELYAKAPDERTSPASTTKMVSALVIIEWGKLDRRVTIEARDFDQPDDSAMGLEPGDVVTVEDLLWGMLLPSGSDAALAAARTVGTDLLAGAPGDPVARFVQEMNGRAARLGLKDTQFRNPHGNDVEGQYSTARDLMKIASEALRSPLVAQIVGTKETTRKTVDGKVSFPLTNTNQLLGQRDGLHGVKTGHTDGCGWCLVSAQWGPGGRILTVVLGSATDAERFSDTVALLDWTNSAYRWVPLGREAAPPGLGPALDRWGVVFRETRTVVLPAWEEPTLRYRLQLSPGGVADAPRGQVIFLAGADRREVLRLPVYAVGASGSGVTPTPGRSAPARP
jgi:D-alanyl-D-alanine carboxypeptidase